MKLLNVFVGVLAAASWAEPQAASSTTEAGKADASGIQEIVRVLDREAVDAAHERGIALYQERRYDEALPHLEIAAQHGRAYSQARLGVLYIKGYGVERDELKALAWLGVAARGSDDDAIEAMFNAAFDQVADDKVGEVLMLIDDYVAQYGPQREQSLSVAQSDYVYTDDQTAEARGCTLARVAGSHIKREICDTEPVSREYLKELDRRIKFQDTIGTRRREAYEDPIPQAYEDTGLHF